MVEKQYRETPEGSHEDGERPTGQVAGSVEASEVQTLQAEDSMDLPTGAAASWPPPNGVTSTPMVRGDKEDMDAAEEKVVVPVGGSQSENVDGISDNVTLDPLVSMHRVQL